MRTLAAFFLLAAAVLAQDLGFDRDAINMIPEIDPAVRNKCAQQFEIMRRAVAQWGKRVGEINQKLQGKVEDEEKKALVQERAQLAQKLRDAPTELDQRLTTEAGLPGDKLARLRAMPLGALRRERYNHGVLLEAPELTTDQRAFLGHLVAATDAAQAAIEEQRTLLARGLDGEEDKLVRQRIESSCRQQIHAIERRFWRIAYYALTPDQMRGVRDLFSPRYRSLPELEQQLYVLPDLEPSQANRLRALFREVESETAADDAEIRRLQVEMRDRELSQEERQGKQQQIGAAYRRAAAVRETLQPGIETTLSEAQYAKLRAAPPILNLGERSRAPIDIVREIRLRPDQRAPVEEAIKEPGKALQKIQQDRREASKDMAAAGLGSDSPQMMTMQMMATGARGETMDVYRDLGGKLVLELLDPEQVAGWVAAPSVRP